MKSTLLMICLVMAFGIGHSQVVTLINKTSLLPVAGAEITGKGEVVVVSGHDGKADISSLSASDSITIRHVSYHPISMKLSDVGKEGSEITLTEHHFNLDEFVVSAHRFSEERKDLAQSVEIVQRRTMEFANQQNSGDVLQNTGNVFLQKSQFGGGSPILRGFEANKVLMVVDGVRMNNAIYRGGHLQNVITLDNTAMEKIEILYGPSSVVYGSDALGGVMHFYTKDPIHGTAEKKEIQGNAFLRYASANSENTGHIDFNVGGGKFASFTNVNFSKFGDLRQGAIRNPFYDDFGKQYFVVEDYNGQDSAMANDDVNVQTPSGYQQVDFLQKFLYKQNDRVVHGLNFQYSTSSDVPRYDRLAQTSAGQPRFAEWYYGPQERMLISYDMKYETKLPVADRFHFIVAFQDIEESRHDRRYKASNLYHRKEHLNIISMNFDAEKAFGIHELRYGYEITDNKVDSKAEVENVKTGSRNSADTRYPDGGSAMQSVAAYVTHSAEISPKFIINDGIRINRVMLDATFEDTSFYAFPFKMVKQENNAVNGSLGLVYMPGMDWRFNLLGSSGFRAPNVDDLSKVFESVPGNVIVPNPELRPEYTYNIDLGFSKVLAKTVTFGSTAFYTWYRDAITTQPGTFNGEDSIMYEGQLSAVSMNVNASEAYIYGLNAFLNAELSRNLTFYNTFNYTYGRIVTDTVDYPLDHIPPIYGKSGLLLVLKRFRTDAFVMYNGWKRISSYNLIGEDNIASATENGMPAWYTLNLRTAYFINKHFQIQFAAENILDHNYRVFASGISSPGRNFVVTLRAAL